MKNTDLRKCPTCGATPEFCRLERSQRTSHGIRNARMNITQFPQHFNLASGTGKQQRARNLLNTDSRR